MIHFGTHGNLEYTPGKNVAQSQADWSDVLIGNLPHFYFYTTGNVGEGIIAKRRTHAVLVTHLTPPYVESGMRQRYSALLEDIHKVLDEGTEKHRTLGISIKKKPCVWDCIATSTSTPSPVTPTQPRSWNVWMPSPKR